MSEAHWLSRLNQGQTERVEGKRMKVPSPGLGILTPFKPAPLKGAGAFRSRTAIELHLII